MNIRRTLLSDRPVFPTGVSGTSLLDHEESTVFNQPKANDRTRWDTFEKLVGLAEVQHA
jgi:hypothetical protein